VIGLVLEFAALQGFDFTGNPVAVFQVDHIRPLRPGKLAEHK
jgi:hypothetical protein